MDSFRRSTATTSSREEDLSSFLYGWVGKRLLSSLGVPKPGMMMRKEGVFWNLLEIHAKWPKEKKEEDTVLTGANGT